MNINQTPDLIDGVEELGIGIGIVDLIGTMIKSFIQYHIEVFRDKIKDGVHAILSLFTS